MKERRPVKPAKPTRPAKRARPVPRPLARLRKLCLGLPEAHEVEAWGEPTFRVKNKLFAMYAAANNHHGHGRPGVWIKSTRLSQDLMVRTSPNRFFVPPYVGPSGWVGVWLDRDVDWDEIAGLLRDAWKMTAPRRLQAALSDQGVTATIRSAGASASSR